MRAHGSSLVMLMRAFEVGVCVCAFVTIAKAQPTEPSPPPPNPPPSTEPTEPPAQEPTAPVTTPTPPEPPRQEPVEPTPRFTKIDLTPPLGLLPTSDDALIDPRMARSWAFLPERWFVATTIDVGFVYARPRVSFGFGKPFTSWAGIDLNPVASTNGLGAYGGIRLEIPLVDLRVGSRYFRAFTHTYLDPKPSFDRLALETEAGDVATTLTHEAELDLSIPLGPGSLLGRGSASYVTGVPDGKLVLEETLRVIMAPPFVWRGRGGYAIRLGKYKQHSVGFVVDVLNVPKRDDSSTVRAGPVLRIVLSRRVEVRGSFVLTVLSPDRIGLAGSDFTELGVRYRWATE